MDVKEIHRRNLRMLVDAAGGAHRFAPDIDRQPNLVTQWLSSKPMADKAARHIEKSLRKPHGWMDAPQWMDAAPESADPANAPLLDRALLRSLTRKVMDELNRPGVIAPDLDVLLDILFVMHDYIKTMNGMENADAFVRTVLRALGAKQPTKT